MMLWLFLICFALLIYYLYQRAYKNDKYFENKAIRVLKPLPFLGNTWKMVFRKLSPPEFIEHIYLLEPDVDILGIYENRRPLYLIRDPELVKYLAVKEFDHFLDHRSQLVGNPEPLFQKSLVALQGHQWKEMRSKLSPAFTGNKMRLMFQLVAKCGDNMINYLSKTTKEKTIDVKDFFTLFANDVIATCAFGLEVNSLENPKNYFREIGKRMISNVSFLLFIKFLIVSLSPKLSKILKLSFFNQKDLAWFRSTILNTIETREKENIIRPDMINLLINAKKGQLISSTQEQNDINVNNEFSAVDEQLKESSKLDWSDDELVAQCFIFFLAGFETVSTAMCFMAYELAMNPDVQKKLIDEIEQVNMELNGELLTYEKLQKMKYMDMVLSETLRKWPPAPFTDRVCTKDLNFEYNNRNLEFKVGENIWIPIYAFHHDPQFYPNPKKFDPERFSDERKHEINQNTYMPFGIGPRNCIGSRFALMEIKAIFYYILLKFTFEVCEKTEVNYKFGRKNFRMLPDNGMWLKLKSR